MLRNKGIISRPVIIAILLLFGNFAAPVFSNSSGNDELDQWTKSSKDPREWGKAYVLKTFPNAWITDRISLGMGMVLERIREVYPKPPYKEIIKGDRCKQAAYARCDDTVSHYSNLRERMGAYDTWMGILKSLGGMARGKTITDLIKEKGKKKVLELLKKKIKGQKPEVFHGYLKMKNKDGVKDTLAVTAIWIKSAGKYEVYFSGDSQMHRVAIPFTKPLRSQRLGRWSLKATGRISVVINNNNRISCNVTVPMLKMLADCSRKGKSIRVFSNVPSTPSDRFKKNTDNRFCITSHLPWDKTPYHVTDPFSTSFIRKRHEKIILAGDVQGTASWKVDNFIFVEVVTRKDVKRFCIGAVNQVEYQGKIISKLGVGYNHDPFDLTPYIPSNSKIKISIYALDYGGIGYVSDLFIVCK